MRVARLGLSALALTYSGCLRFGYGPGADHKPDTSQGDAGVMYVHDAAVKDAAVVDPTVAGAGGSAGAIAGSHGGVSGQPSAGAGGAGSAGSAGASSAEDAGAPPSEPEIGDTGLVVSDILGYYSGDWGEMVLERRDAEIWGVYVYNDGTIIGAITDDGVFAGWWSQLPTRVDGINAGEVEFRWRRSELGAIELDGRWRYGSSGVWLENWNVDLVTDRSAPTELTEAFRDTEDFRRHP